MRVSASRGIGSPPIMGRQAPLVASLGAIVLAAILSACGGGGDGAAGASVAEGSPQVQENFVSACVTSATSTTGGSAIPSQSDAGQICSCMYNELKARLPFADFKTADEALSKGEQLSGDLAATIQPAAGTCT